MNRFNNVHSILILSVLTGLWFAVEIGSLLRQTCQVPNKNCSKGGIQNRTDYIAAVVEYKPIPIGNQTPLEAVLSNVKEYILLIEEANHHGVDIIVFPEYGLTTIALSPQREQARKFFVHVPEIGSTPCDESYHTSKSTQILYDLSCAAKNHDMYIVVNLGEIDQCVRDDNTNDKNCPADGAFHYNTNVAFDRNGTIIAKYRKFHLYFEPQFDYPQLEYSTFKTDFGVEFGLLTCFDIIFAHPAVEMIASKSIRNFAFPTAWVDELPFLTAIQAQSLWAQSNKANLLGSGYHQPDRGSMGSGIYSGHHDGALEYIFDPESGTKLLISPVPIHPEIMDTASWRKPLATNKLHNKNSHANHFWLREDLSNCSHKTIDLNSNQDTVCYEDVFCCDIEYEIIPTSGTIGQMKLIVFDGRRTVAAKRDWFEWQVCAVVHCLNETVESCAENTDIHNLKFEKLSIKVQPLKVEYEQEAVSEPALSLLDTSFNLIPQQHFEVSHWRDHENGISYAKATTKKSINLANVQVKTVALIQKVYSGRL